MILPTRLIRSGSTPGDEIGVGVGGRRPEHVGEAVGDEAVTSSGIAFVAAPEPRLEVDERDLELAATIAQAAVVLTSADHDRPVRSQASATFS